MRYKIFHQLFTSFFKIRHDFQFQKKQNNEVPNKKKNNNKNDEKNNKNAIDNNILKLKTIKIKRYNFMSANSLLTKTNENIFDIVPKKSIFNKRISKASEPSKQINININVKLLENSSSLVNNLHISSNSTNSYFRNIRKSKREEANKTINLTNSIK